MPCAQMARMARSLLSVLAHVCDSGRDIRIKDTSRLTSSASWDADNSPFSGIFCSAPVFVRMSKAVVRWIWRGLASSSCSKRPVSMAYLIPLPHNSPKAVLSLVAEVVGLLDQGHTRNRIAIESLRGREKFFRGLDECIVVVGHVGGAGSRSVQRGQCAG